MGQDKILICLDRLKYPNSGLGRVSEDFTMELLKTGKDCFSFLVPTKDISFLAGQMCELLTLRRHFCSGYLKKYRLVHVLHQMPSYAVSGAAKMVLTIHDLNFLYTTNLVKRERYRRRIQRLIDKADGIAFISEFTKNDCYRHLQISENKLTKVIYNGVNDLAEPSAKPDWCPKEKFLFSIGVFLEKKNFHVLLAFMKCIPEDIKLVIAGDHSTTYGRFIIEEVLRLKLQERVVLPGMISESQKSYLYHHCEAFLFPSIAEGFGLPVIEAMRVGKPVFSSPHTSLKEIGSVYSYYWDSFDEAVMTDIFYEGMKDYCLKPMKAQQMIDYSKKFSWLHNASEYMQLYEEVLMMK